MKSFREEIVNDLKSNFPTTLDCLEKMVVTATAVGLIKCSTCCSEKQIERENHSNLLYCTLCKTITRIFSSTIFKGMQRPLAWYSAIYLAEQEYLISSLDLATLTSITEPSARSIMRKLKTVIGEDLSPTKLSTNQASQTDKLLPPDLSPNALSVYVHISETPTSFDSLISKSQLPISPFSSALFELELAQVIESLPGNRFVILQEAPEAKNSKSQKTSNHDLENYLHSRVHEPDWLLIACLKHVPIRDMDLKNARRHEVGQNYSDGNSMLRSDGATPACTT